MNDEAPEQINLTKNQRNKRIAIAVASVVVAACAVIFVCRPDYGKNLIANLSSGFPADQTAKAAELGSSVSRQQPAPSSAASASSAVSSSSQESSSASPKVSMVTAPAQVSLEKAKLPLAVDVSIAAQRVTVFDADRLIVKQFVCSTGSPGNDTPTGTFTVQSRGESFYSETVKEGGYYWTQFHGNYLFHSVPFDKNRQLEPEEAAKIGTPASHGCVRLSIDDAKWIYDNIPRGTAVTIHKNN